MTTTKPLTAAQRMRVQAAAGMPVAVSPEFLRAVAGQTESAERLISVVGSLNDAIAMQRRIIAIWRLLAATQTVLIIALAVML